MFNEILLSCAMCDEYKCCASWKRIEPEDGCDVVLTAGEYRGGLKAVEGERSNADGRSTDG